MTPTAIFHDVVVPGLLYMTRAIGPGGPTTDAPARVMIMSIWGQESDWRYRRQNGGPARSYGQFESGGGVAGVMGNATTSKWLQTVCAALDIPYDRSTIFEAMAWNDLLALAMTRFNLWCAPGPLPAVGQRDAAWNYYVNQWRPGKPHPDAWPRNYDTAMRVVMGDAPVTA